MARIRWGTRPKDLTSVKVILNLPGGAAPPTIGQTKLNNVTYEVLTLAVKDKRLNTISYIHIFTNIT